MKFYLGTHQPAWLARTTVPLFVSHRRLCSLKKLPSAVCTWALDSGGFSELSMYGEWRTSAKIYVAATLRYMEEIGQMQWAAIQDWMCEPFMLAKTKLTIYQHQQRTVQSYLELKSLASSVPWVPVLQGYVIDDYKRHLDQYGAAGIDLWSFNRVGVGSICRRQHTDEIVDLITYLSQQGLKLHGFGVKLKGLERLRTILVSADSMAWSKQARHEEPLPNHEINHKNCANCRIYAELWYRLKVWPLIQGLRNEKIDSRRQTTHQGYLFDSGSQGEDMEITYVPTCPSSPVSCLPDDNLSSSEWTN